MVWLRADMDDQDRSIVSTLWCVVCRKYETRMCGFKNFSRAWIDGSSNHKTSNITDIPTCIFCNIYTVALKHNYHIRTTFK